MILIAIGANLPGAGGRMPLATCRAAAESLAGLAGLRLFAMSGWYTTTPIPASSQPDYINAVARLEGTVDPADLLRRLHAIEARAGRRRGVRDAARTLDLDIVDMDGLRRDAPDPVLPHPRAHVRAFVLRPLLDVCPDWIHPRLGRSAADLLAALPDQGVRPV
jgi:2-amino-4-hydroxy-6-hydroxymethyldihydropteridine diphosphokinase